MKVKIWIYICKSQINSNVSVFQTMYFFVLLLKHADYRIRYIMTYGGNILTVVFNRTHMCLIVFMHEFDGPEQVLNVYNLTRTLLFGTFKL